MIPTNGVVITLLTLFGVLASYFYPSEDYVEVEPGVEIYTKSFGGIGSDIIVVNGNAAIDNSNILAYLLPLAKDYRLHFFDQRGCGKSLTYEGCSDMDTLVSDIEAIRVKMGLENVTLLGHKDGASISLCYALNYPDHVNNLILITPEEVDLSVSHPVLIIEEINDVEVLLETIHHEMETLQSTDLLSSIK